MATKARKKQRSAARHAARQERKREAAAANPPQAPGGELLCHPERIHADMSLVSTAVKNDWNVQPEQRQKLVTRLMEIVEKQVVDVPCGDGIFPSAATADANAIKAAALVKSMTDANARRLAAHQPKQGTTINVGVNVDNRTDERRNRTLAIAERVRAGRILHVDSSGTD